MKVYTGDIDQQTAHDLSTLNYPIFSVDVETTGLDPLKDELKVVTLWDNLNGAGYYIRITDENPIELRSFLQNYEHMFIFHHAMFDLSFIYKRLGVIPERVCCTKIQAKVIDPMRTQGSQSLKALLLRRGITELEKDEDIQKGDWSQEPTESMLKYAEGDVKYLLELHNRQSSIIFKDAGKFADYAIARDMLPQMVYQKIAYNGGLFGY